MFDVKFKPTKKYGAKEVAAAASRWYFGSHGSEPMPTEAEAVEVAENALRAQVEHAGELGEFYTLEAVPHITNVD